MKKLFIASFCFLIFVSCGTIRKGAVNIFDEYPKNVAAGKQIGITLCETWAFRSGWLGVVFENEKDRLPSYITYNFQKLNEICVDCQNINDKTAAEIIARRGVLVSEMARSAYESLKLPVGKIIDWIF